MIVIPPSSQGVVDEILSDPVVLTPRPTRAVSAPPVNYGQLQPGQTAVVLQGPLNVRNAPDTGVATLVLTQLQRGDDLTVLQISADGAWAYIDTRGPAFVQGWASTRYIAPFDNQPDNFAPGLPDEPASGQTLIALETVNIRAAPVIFSARVGILAENTRAEIIGTTNTYSWWKIKVDGTVGWVAGAYIYPENPTAYSSVPIIR